MASTANPLDTLHQTIEEHLKRLIDLAKEAEEDAEETFSSRASAMSSLSRMLNDLTKTQSEVINMKRLLSVEQALIETAKELFEPEQYETFNSKLVELLSKHDE